MKTLQLLLGIGLMSTLFGLSPGFAAPSPKTLEQRIAELEQEVQLLKRQREAGGEVQLKKDAEAPAVLAGKGGFALKAKDQAFQLKIRGQIQADARNYIADNTSAGFNTFLIRRARPILEGTVYKYFDFRLMPDFGGGTTALQDAYIDFKYWPKASVRFGKFKAPVSLERLQADANKSFIEDSLVSNLVPNRDVGVDLHGELFEGAVNYDAGVFNGVPDGVSADTDNHDDKDFVGRIFALPFKNTTHGALNKLGIGVGGSVGRAHGSTGSSQLPGFKSGGQENFFSYASGVFADGGRFRIAPQGYYYNGPFGLLGEWAFSSQRVRKGISDGTIKNSAWEVTSSYVLTGENASYEGVIPRDNFDPGAEKWGAFETVARINSLGVEKGAFPVFANASSSADQAFAWGVGLNWYLNKSLKFMSDFEETFYNSGDVSGADRKNENALLSRLQMMF